MPGVVAYRLRLRDVRQQLMEDVALPLQVEADPAPRVLVLAGAPNPELKYLRRWASDASLSMHTQIAAGGGMQLGDAPISMTAANLSRFDVAVLDERAWSAMGEAQRAALLEAVRGGLGLLLRVTAALSEPEQRRLRALGFAVLKGAGFLAEDVRRLQASHGTITDNWSLETAYHFGGYARRNAVLDDFIVDFEARHGVRLDWVYVAKMMYGIFDVAERGNFASGTNIVAVITG